MDRSRANDDALVFARQLEAIIAFADEHQDFVLAAMLAGAHARLASLYIGPRGNLPEDQ